MNKDDLVFSIIGIGAGLVIGFLLSNWTWKPPSSVPQQTASSATAHNNSAVKLPGSSQPGING